ncbi:hypothetical protein [Amycolatopsis panacis]|uniref:hypothetical protein n=1 Tax=Amycolatopsis panacis TaxID=2340917 RepID=UPI00131497F6|nr:hypothetical protein [Amycolatopsis panacis]
MISPRAARQEPFAVVFIMQIPAPRVQQQLGKGDRAEDATGIVPVGHALAGGVPQRKFVRHLSKRVVGVNGDSSRHFGPGRSFR